MIRINLLPQKRRAEQRAEASQLWLLAVLAAFLLEVVGLFVLHSLKGEELKDQNRKNAELTTQIERSTKAVANHKEIKDQLKPYHAQMETAVYNQTFNNLLLKRLREQFAVPRLSLFYV